MGIPEYENSDEFFENDIVYELQNQVDLWRIKDLSTAHWADEMIHEREVIIAEKEKIANDAILALEAKIEKQKEWLDRATRKEKSDIDFFINHLKMYHMNIIEEEKKLNAELKAKGKKEKPLTKTIKLPYRDLTSKVQLPEIVRNNDEELIKWVENNHTNNIPVEVIAKVIEDKINGVEEDNEAVLTVTEILEIVKQYDTDYIKRENKLAWSEWKKTLSQVEVPIVQNDEKGNEVVVGSRLVYFDENGSEVPYVELHPKEDKFDWKPVKE